MDPIARALLDLWFSDWTEQEPLPKQSSHMKLWWSKNEQTDADLRARFGDASTSALQGEFDAWRTDAEAVTGLVLLLDQIPRNIHRGTARAFACDAKAREVTKGAIAAGIDTQAALIHRYFLYMPLMHSEEHADHDLAVERFSNLVTEAQASGSQRLNCYEQALHYEQLHRGIVDRFGRYPHRNALLGRQSTPEETVFLEQPGSSF